MIIGIHGAMGSGKSTFATYLEEMGKEEGDTFHTISLADPIKDLCKEIFNFTDTQLWGPSEERNKPDKRYSYQCECRGQKTADQARFGSPAPQCATCGGTGISGYLTPRKACQLLGTEFGRACWPDIWVTRLIQKAQLVPAGAHVLVPDVRFSNEAQAILDAGGTLVRIECPSLEEGELADTARAHASEAGVPEYMFPKYGRLQNFKDRFFRSSVKGWYTTFKKYILDPSYVYLSEENSFIHRDKLKNPSNKRTR